MLGLLGKPRITEAQADLICTCIEDLSVILRDWDKFPLYRQRCRQLDRIVPIGWSTCRNGVMITKTAPGCFDFKIY